MIKMGFLEHFQEYNQTQKIFSKMFFRMQPNTWKYFPFSKMKFPENILREPNTT